MDRVEICNESLARLIGAKPDRNITAENLNDYISSHPIKSARVIRRQLLERFFLEQALSQRP